MIGIELASDIPALSNDGKAVSLQFVNRLHDAGLLTIPSGTQVIRLLPPLNLSRQEAEEGIRIFEKVVGDLV
jgi:acetylornithine/succinyldiaminopimelate/putrescine aminotransferase